MSNSTTLDANVPISASTEWRRHWPVAFGALIGNGTGIAVYSYVSSLFIPSLQKEFGWSRGDISSASALGYVGVLAAPFIGKAVDRFGVRPMAAVFAIMVGLLFIGYATLNGSLMMLSMLTAGMLIAAPANSAPIYGKALSGWFVESRGLALGLTACGVPLMAMVASFALQFIIETHGWRTGYLALAAMVTLIGLPCVLAMVKEASPDDTSAPINFVPKKQAGELTFRAAAKTRAFWLLLIAVIFCTAPSQGFLSQLTPFLTDNGFTTADAAAFLSLYSAAVIVGRLGTGYLLDRFSPYFIAFLVTLVPAAGLLILISLSNPGFAITAIAVGIIGLQNGGESDILPYFIAREFGIENFSSIFGVTFTGAFVASAFGVFLLGKVFDLTGSYNLALWLFIAFFSIASISYFAIGIKSRSSSLAH